MEKGEFVTTGFVGDRGAKGYVVSMADLNDLQVELDINQNDFARARSAGRSAIVTTDAYPDRKYDGVIDEISPEANRQKATVQVKVKVLNPDEFLRPEMNASVAFVSEEKQASRLGAVDSRSSLCPAIGRARRRGVRRAERQSGPAAGEDDGIDVAGPARRRRPDRRRRR